MEINKIKLINLSFPTEIFVDINSPGGWVVKHEFYYKNSDHNLIKKKTGFRQMVSEC